MAETTDMTVNTATHVLAQIVGNILAERGLMWEATMKVATRDRGAEVEIARLWDTVHMGQRLPTDDFYRWRTAVDEYAASRTSGSVTIPGERPGPREFYENVDGVLSAWRTRVPATFWDLFGVYDPEFPVAGTEDEIDRVISEMAFEDDVDAEMESLRHVLDLEALVGGGDRG